MGVTKKHLERVHREQVLPLKRYKMRAYYAKQRAANKLHKQVRSAQHLIRERIKRVIDFHLEKRSHLSKKDRRFKRDIERKFQSEMCWDNFGKFPNSWVVKFEVPLTSARNKYEITKYSRNWNIIPTWHNSKLNDVEEKS